MRLSLLNEADIDIRRLERLARSGDVEAAIKALRMKQREFLQPIAHKPIQKQIKKLGKTPEWRLRHLEQVPYFPLIFIQISFNPRQAWHFDEVIERARNLIRLEGFEVGDFQPVQWDMAQGWIVGNLPVERELLDQLEETGSLDFSTPEISIYAEMP